MTAGSSGALGQEGTIAKLSSAARASTIGSVSWGPCSRATSGFVPACSRPESTASRWRAVVKMIRGWQSVTRRATCAALYAVSRGTAMAPSRRMPEVRRAPVRVILGQDGASIAGHDALKTQPGRDAARHHVELAVRERVETVPSLDFDCQAVPEPRDGRGELFEEVPHGAWRRWPDHNAKRRHVPGGPEGAAAPGVRRVGSNWIDNLSVHSDLVRNGRASSWALSFTRNSHTELRIRAFF